MLVQLVCLDRRYQRMNCYNIREIQTILKSKYSPASADSSDVHFGLNDTAIGLRYQVSGLDFIDPSIFTYYRNSITNHPRYQMIHEFLHKPITDFNSVKVFMSKCSLMYSVIQALYRDESEDVQAMFSSSNLASTGYTSSTLATFVPQVDNAVLGYSLPTVSDAQFVAYSLNPKTLFLS